MKYIKSFIILGFLIISFGIVAYILGINNLSFSNTNWLAAHDVSTDIVSWKFYRDDFWRFPLGSNPNYGMDIGSGIAFSGSIPLMAIIFKIFNSILPENFHYFSLWIFICFFLSGYISYLIILSKTKDIPFSLIGSLFFILSPILINRLGFHLSLCAHWLILIGFYFEIKNINKKEIYWAILISVSSLVHFYFTVMLLIIFFSFLISNLEIRNIKKSFIVIIPLIIIMYLVGYFDVPFSDALALGYGNYSLDLASFFINKSNIVNGNVDWSFFLKNQNQIGAEGFGYLGLGGILLFTYLIFIFVTRFKYIIKKKKFISILILVIIFSLIAVSNKIYFLNNLFYEIEIPKILYGLLSVVRASGRMIWPVYYIILIISILIIYQNFSKKNALIILFFIFIIQIIDIHPGIKSHYNSKAFVKENNLVDKDFWEEFSFHNPILRTTYLNNQSRFLHELRNVLLLDTIKKTDISIHGRYNRKQASISRSNLYSLFEKKKIPKGILFAIDNDNHLRNLYYLFKDENVGFFYRDKNWIIVDGYKDRMTQNDFKLLENSIPPILKLDNVNYFNFKDEKSLHGLGWTHSNNTNFQGIWSEGNVSTILFKIDENVNDEFKIKIKYNSFLTKNNKPFNFEIYFNENLYEKFRIQKVNNKSENFLIFNLNKKMFPNKIVYLKFHIDQPTSKLDLLKSPDARRLGILIENIRIYN